MANEQTNIMEVTPAMAAVIVSALHSYEGVINGDFDGMRRCPWDHYAMDVSEGEPVPGLALTEEQSFRELLRLAREEAQRVIDEN